jgi:hypothetical protein
VAAARASGEPADGDRRLEEFVELFRETKHFILNSVAIWAAQAEMAKRDPKYAENLIESVLERTPKVAELTRKTEEHLKTIAPYTDGR